MHGGDELWKLAIREDELYKDSWLEGLRHDLQWINAGAGQGWGEDLPEVQEGWNKAKSGWKTHVKNSLFKHTLRSAIHWYIEGDGHTGKEEASQNSHQSVWTCQDCGAHFTTKRGLAVHAMKKHQQHTAVYQLVQGSTCPCCLTQFWTEARLRQHLTYVYRTKSNWCFKYLGATGFDRDECEAEDRDVPLPGLHRRDSIRVEGPMNCGACEDHGRYLLDAIQEIENQWDNSQQAHPSNVLDDEVQGMMHCRL